MRQWLLMGKRNDCGGGDGEKDGVEVVRGCEGPPEKTTPITFL